MAKKLKHGEKQVKIWSYKVDHPLASASEVAKATNTSYGYVHKLFQKIGTPIEVFEAQVEAASSPASRSYSRDNILDIAKEFPELVAAIIALASDAYTPKALDIARDLPFNTQLELIEGVFNNTFTSEADVKKLIESLTKMAVGASGALVQIRQTGLLSGTGE
jgi:hypothetical protein